MRKADFFDNFVISHMGLVYKIANKFRKLGEIEDLIQIGCIGLIKAARTFDYTKGFQFSTYAYKVIQSEFLQVMASQNMKKRQGATISLEEVMCNSEDFEKTIEDCLSIEEDFDSFEDKDFVRNLFTQLNEKEHEVITLRYGFDGKGYKTLEEVGKLFNLTRERIRQIEKKALRKLKTRAVMTA